MSRWWANAAWIALGAGVVAGVVGGLTALFMQQFHDYETRAVSIDGTVLPAGVEGDWAAFHVTWVNDDVCEFQSVVAKNGVFDDPTIPDPTLELDFGTPRGNRADGPQTTIGGRPWRIKRQQWVGPDIWLVAVHLCVRDGHLVHIRSSFAPTTVKALFPED